MSFPRSVLGVDHASHIPYREVMQFLGKAFVDRCQYASGIPMGMQPLMPIAITGGVSLTIHPALSNLHSIVPLVLWSRRLRFCVSHAICTGRSMLWQSHGFGSALAGAPELLCCSRAVNEYFASFRILAFEV